MNKKVSLREIVADKILFAVILGVYYWMWARDDWKDYYTSMQYALSGFTICYILLRASTLRKFKKEEPYTITRDPDGVWVISGKEVERIFKMTKFNSEEAIYRFAKKLRRLGIDAKLESLGAEAGDQVRILDFYFDYKD